MIWWESRYFLTPEEQVQVLGEVDLDEILNRPVNTRDEEEQHAEAVLFPKPGESAKE